MSDSASRFGPSARPDSKVRALPFAYRSLAGCEYELPHPGTKPNFGARAVALLSRSPAAQAVKQAATAYDDLLRQRQAARITGMQSLRDDLQAGHADPVAWITQIRGSPSAVPARDFLTLSDRSVRTLPNPRFRAGAEAVDTMRSLQLTEDLRTLERLEAAPPRALLEREEVQAGRAALHRAANDRGMLVDASLARAFLLKLREMKGAMQTPAWEGGGLTRDKTLHAFVVAEIVRVATEVVALQVASAGTAPRVLDGKSMSVETPRARRQALQGAENNPCLALVDFPDIDPNDKDASVARGRRWLGLLRGSLLASFGTDRSLEALRARLPLSESGDHGKRVVALLTAKEEDLHFKRLSQLNLEFASLAPVLARINRASSARYAELVESRAPVPRADAAEFARIRLGLEFLALGDRADGLNKRVRAAALLHDAVNRAAAAHRGGGTPQAWFDTAVAGIVTEAFGAPRAQPASAAALAALSSAPGSQDRKHSATATRLARSPAQKCRLRCERAEDWILQARQVDAGEQRAHLLKFAQQALDAAQVALRKAQSSDAMRAVLSARIQAGYQAVSGVGQAVA